MTPTQKWPSRERPLNLAGVLRLRNGMKLPKENLSGFATHKTFRRPEYADWLLFTLN